MTALDRSEARAAWSRLLTDAGVGHSLTLVDALVDLLAGIAGTTDKETP